MGESECLVAAEQYVYDKPLTLFLRIDPPNDGLRDHFGSAKVQYGIYGRRS
jgi:hypothetical protein